MTSVLVRRYPSPATRHANDSSLNPGPPTVTIQERGGARTCRSFKVEVDPLWRLYPYLFN